MTENTDIITKKPAIHIVGLGCPEFQIAAYMEHRPDMPGMAELAQLQPAISGEIHCIGQACGNGWRKVFNVYAKLLYALDPTYFDYATSADSWQRFRDQFLLQAGSQTALLFSPPVLDLNRVPSRYHIIMGRTYAKKLIHQGLLNAPLTWLDHEFAVNQEHRLVVCPYFDYRQLSNLKIERLAAILAGFAQTKSASYQSKNLTQ
ncbi:hypothetical protein Q4579_06465 [Photobacterium sp. 1_MG-2023]|nr:hypothetical protein [Photobacterium sp. 1_MG-2023]